MPDLVFFGTPAVVAIAIGYLTGGRLKNIDPFPVGALALLLAAAVLQYIGWHKPRIPGIGLEWTGFPITVLVFACGITGLVWAIKSRIRKCSAAALVILAVGVGLNALVIGVNGGMPTTAAAITAAGEDLSMMTVAVESMKYLPLDAPTRLIFLGDVIPLPPIHVAASIGDLLLVAGMMLFFPIEMSGRNRREESTVEDSSAS